MRRQRAKLGGDQLEVARFSVATSYPAARHVAAI
jgi:hypothetical protein